MGVLATYLERIGREHRNPYDAARNVLYPYVEFCSAMAAIADKQKSAMESRP
jgi:hypothetical protein